MKHEIDSVKAFSSHISGDRIEKGRVFRLEMQPGDVTFHHSNTIHFASRNSSALNRRSLSVRMVGANAKTSSSMRETYQRFFRV